MSEILHPVIYEDDKAVVFLETHKHWGLFVHCYVRKWSLSNLRQFQRQWDEFLDEVAGLGFENVHIALKVGDDKIRAFASHFGFITTGVRISDSKGDTREVYRCNA